MGEKEKVLVVITIFFMFHNVFQLFQYTNALLNHIYLSSANAFNFEVCGKGPSYKANHPFRIKYIMGKKTHTAIYSPILTNLLFMSCLQKKKKKSRTCDWFIFCLPYWRRWRNPVPHIEFAVPCLKAAAKSFPKFLFGLHSLNEMQRKILLFFSVYQRKIYLQVQ